MGRQRSGSAIKEAIVLIPITFNDGTKVPQAELDAIFEELYATFHGWTVEGTVKGAYQMRSGKKRVEDLLKVSVVLDKKQILELEAMMAKWCAKLGQEAMLLKIADFTVKFISPQPE